MLSNYDIIRELGKNIEIYPFSEKNLRGASYYFTASKMAWSISTKKSAVDTNNLTIKIASHDATLILTNEIFAVSNKIAGTFNTRVADAAKGEGHISTVINPGWHGRPLIAVNNPTDNDIFIKINDPFVSMLLDYLKTPSTMKEDSRRNARVDILQGFELSEDEKSLVFNEDECAKIHDLASKESSYAKIKKSDQRKMTRSATILAITVLLSAISLVVLINFQLYQWLVFPTIILTTLSPKLWQKLFG